MADVTKIETRMFLQGIFLDVSLVTPNPAVKEPPKAETLWTCQKASHTIRTILQQADAD